MTLKHVMSHGRTLKMTIYLSKENKGQVKHFKSFILLK